jgi:hypothetical protein
VGTRTPKLYDNFIRGNIGIILPDRQRSYTMDFLVILHYNLISKRESTYETIFVDNLIKIMVERLMKKLFASDKRERIPYPFALGLLIGSCGGEQEWILMVALGLSKS